jgi:hypothetical protein
MDTPKTSIWKETGWIALGQLICVAGMLGVFALLNQFDRSVIFGGVLGGILAVVYYFSIVVCADIAAKKAMEQDVKGGQLLIRNSYMLRLVVLFAILFACAKSGLFNLFALVLPMTFIRPALTIAEFFRKKGNA